MCCFGKIEVSKKHPLVGRGIGGFSISSRLQELMCFIGQKEVFEDGSETFSALMNLDISDNQIKRVSEYYGKNIDQLLRKNCKEVIPQLKLNRDSEPTYTMVDGSMLLTREEGWKEIKLGRIFKGDNLIDIQSNRSAITQSVFVSHLGGCQDFFTKLERHLTEYKNLVIIGDGAKWIWNWAEDNYPGAKQILDFYHAYEKLGQFAMSQMLNLPKKEKWMLKQKTKLLEGKLDEILNEIKGIRPRNQEACQRKQDVINYYVEHEDRMDYRSYRKLGLLIGSGPIESAHRNVIQTRMKHAGQRWSKEGAKAIANLRCYKKGKNWKIISNLIKKAA